MPIQRIAGGTRAEAMYPEALKARWPSSSPPSSSSSPAKAPAWLRQAHLRSRCTPSSLVAAAVAHAFALVVAVSVDANISGGHVNPAFTFSAFIGGHISLLRGILYWIEQLLGSTVACLLLQFATNGMATKAFSLSAGVGV